MKEINIKLPHSCADFEDLQEVLGPMGYTIVQDESDYKSLILVDESGKRFTGYWFDLNVTIKVENKRTQYVVNVLEISSVVNGADEYLSSTVKVGCIILQRSNPVLGKPTPSVGDEVKFAHYDEREGIFGSVETMGTGVVVYVNE